MSEINRVQPVEIERVQLDEKTIHTIYQVGHSRTSWDRYSKRRPHGTLIPSVA